MAFRVIPVLWVFAYLFLAASNAHALWIVSQPGQASGSDDRSFFLPLGGCPITFRVIAAGAGTLNYQWERAAIISNTCTTWESIPGATLETYQATSGTQAEEYCLRARVSNGTQQIVSREITVQASEYDQLIFTNHASLPSLDNAFPNNGALVELRAQACGPGPISYQWYMTPNNGSPQIIPGAVENTYSFLTGSEEGGRSYFVVASNAAGSIQSRSSYIFITSQPVFRFNPQYSIMSAAAGSTVQIPFDIITPGTISVQSYFYNQQVSPPQRVDVGICTTTHCSVPIETVMHQRRIAVRATNQFGERHLQGPSIIIAGAPSAAVPPETTVRFRSDPPAESALASFRATLAGSAPMQYQWMKNGVDIPGASGTFVPPDTIGQTWTLATSISVLVSDLGSRYRVRLTNEFGSSESAETVLVAPMPPRILQDPQDTTVQEGAVARFSVVAVGTNPLRYQWYRNGAAIEGAISDSYDFTTTAPGNAGVFSVVVSNELGSIESGTATLLVTEGPAGGPGDPACRDLLDNDGDGKVDFPDDPGCTSAEDETETNEPAPIQPQCRDGIDNDGDLLIDLNDPGCADPDDPLEGGSSSPSDPGQPTPPNDPPGCESLDLSPLHVYLRDFRALSATELRKLYNRAVRTARKKGLPSSARVKRIRAKALAAAGKRLDAIVNGTVDFGERILLCGAGSGCVQVNNIPRISALQAIISTLVSENSAALSDAYKKARVQKKRLEAAIRAVQIIGEKFDIAVRQIPVQSSACGHG